MTSNPKSKKHLPSPIDAKLLVAASEINADMLYATKFFAPDSFIYFEFFGRSYSVMSDLEIDRAHRQAKVNTILSLSHIQQEISKQGHRTIDTAAVIDWIFTKKKIKMVQVPYEFPTGLAWKLRRRGFKIIPKPEPFFEERQIKQRQEIREISKAQNTAENALIAGIEMIRDSRINSNKKLILNGVPLTAEKVKHKINSILLSHGYLASHTIVAGGNHGCDPHNEGHGPLPAHKPIILDIFPRCQNSGYWGDITRTVVRGNANNKIKDIYNAVLSTQTLALDQIKEGSSGRKIHQMIVQTFHSLGFPTGTHNGRMQGFFHGTGHGVGLEIHEPPYIGSKAQDILKKGQVVTVEPGLYYNGIGGVRIEDLVVVTSKGCRNLTKLPKFLEI